MSVGINGRHRSIPPRSTAQAHDYRFYRALGLRVNHALSLVSDRPVRHFALSEWQIFAGLSTEETIRTEESD
jgi:hypothetical protein